MGKEGGEEMSWKYRYPCRADYDTEEEYLHACEMYEIAESDYADAMREEMLEARFAQEINNY